jgi:hypothetical protein
MASIGVEIEILGPDELRDAARGMAARLTAGVA